MKKYWVIVFSIVLMISCKKFLEAPSDKKLVIPSSISELQALLNGYSALNNSYPVTAEILADNYYVTTADWSSISNETIRNHYIWEKDENSGDWFRVYSRIKIANTVLDNLDIITFNPATEQSEFNALKGNALFYRSFYLYAGTQLYSQPYDKATASSDLGMVLRMSADFNIQSVRSTVLETYNQLLQDFKEAAALLPERTDLKTQPSKPAAYGMIAKTYLDMQEFDSAGRYADLCISLYGADSLLNFNTDIDVAATAPFKRFNREVIFHCKNGASGLINNNRAKIDSVLYASYHENDLRKYAYFRENSGANSGTYQFKGDYDGSGTSTGYAFGGVVLDDIYLIRAECFARKGMVGEALADMNKLLESRWEIGAFVPYDASNSEDALQLVLEERRKELLFRGTRWADMRRLMKEAGHAVTYRRIINNTIYELPPNSSKYTLKIPIEVIETAGIPQNP